MIRLCAIVAASSITAVVLTAATAYLVLVYGPDTSISF